MKIILFLLTIAALSSCQTTRPINFNGEELYEVTCNGTARTMADCLESASNTCQERGLKAYPVNEDGSSTLATSNSQIIPVLKRSLLFKCK